MINNSWDNIYKTGNSVRRWPSEDVVKYCSTINQDNDFLVDIGTGTGRNLVPLMLKLKHKGILMAIDISIEGIKQIESWCKDINVKKISKKDLSSDEIKRFEYYNIDFELDKIFNIPKNMFEILKKKDDFNVVSNESIYLVLRIDSMENNKITSKTVDGFINRGSIFYMDKEEIERSIKSINEITKKNGKGLISFKSMKDSRYSNNFLARTVNENKRIIIKGAQTGMSMSFFNQDEIIELLRDFKIIRMEHDTKTLINIYDTCDEITIADYIVYVQTK